MDFSFSREAQQTAPPPPGLADSAARVSSGRVGGFGLPTEVGGR
jgi:hypothetical protein